MITAPAEIDAVINDPDPPLCWVLKLTPKVGAALLLSDHGADVIVGAETYVGRPGFTMSDLTVKVGGEGANVDLTMPVHADGPITPTQIENKTWVGADAALSIVNYQTPSSLWTRFIGTMGKMSYSDGIRGKFQLRSRTGRTFDLTLPKIVAGCPYRFGDADTCGIDMVPLLRTAVVATVISKSAVTVTMTHDGFGFTNGEGVWQTGDNTGILSQIRLWTVGTLRMDFRRAVPFTIQVGDTIQVHPGCAHTPAACKAYSNYANYGGDDPPGPNFNFGFFKG